MKLLYRFFMPPLKAKLKPQLGIYFNISWIQRCIIEFIGSSCFQIQFLLVTLCSFLFNCQKELQIQITLSSHFLALYGVGCLHQLICCHLGYKDEAKMCPSCPFFFSCSHVSINVHTTIKMRLMNFDFTFNLIFKKFNTKR